MNVTLLSYTQDPEKVVAAAAKLCYSNSSATKLFEDLTDESAKKFIYKLSKMGHQSPLEHASFSFAIEGVSRSLLAQITRHRIASFSVQSQRYVDMSDKFDPITPTDIINNNEACKIFDDFMNEIPNYYIKIRDTLLNSYLYDEFYDIVMKQLNLRVSELEEVNEKLKKDFYKYVIEFGFTEDSKNETYACIGAQIKEKRKIYEKRATENARAILPNSCPTQLIVTMNARELLHFFNERCCNRAQEEIRELAWRMLILVRNVAPSIFVGAGPSCLHGACKEGPMTCGKRYFIKYKDVTGFKLNNQWLTFNDVVTPTEISIEKISLKDI